MAKRGFEELIDELMSLGFSQYEATIYVGLVRGGEMTGYALAKATRVPHAKVYENLNRLTERGYVVRLGADPAHYIAIPPKKLLSSLESEYHQSLDAANRLLGEISGAGAEREFELVWKLDEYSTVLESAREAIARAEKRIYLSGTSKVLDALADSLDKISEKDVAVTMMHFGPVKFAIRRGSAIRHRSTEGIVSWRHQSQHLALCVDSAFSVWAVAKDGRNWSGSAGDYPPLAWLVKAYIRHDIYLQRVFADMPDELHARYGPSLHGLVQSSLTEPTTPASTESEAKQSAEPKKQPRAVKMRHIL